MPLPLPNSDHGSGDFADEATVVDDPGPDGDPTLEAQRGSGEAERAGVGRGGAPAAPSGSVDVSAFAYQRAVPAPATPPPAPPAPPGVHGDPDAQARLASLSGLSLDKERSGQLAAAPRSSSKLPWILLVLVLAAGGYYVATRPPGGAPSSETAGQDTPEPAPQAAQGSADEPSLLASGYMAARSPILLSASIGGRLTEVRVDNGDRIAKGDVVAVLGDGQIRAELGLARARLADARRTHRRMRRLARAQAATSTQLEKAAGQVQIARAEVKVIERKLEETRIRAPIDGTVLKVLAHPGETVSAGSSESAGVLRIADLSSLVAEVNIDESDLEAVFLEQPAEISRRGQGETYGGRVREIAEQADRARGTVLVRVDVDTPEDHSLRPGMAVQVRFGADGKTAGGKERDSRTARDAGAAASGARVGDGAASLR